MEDHKDFNEMALLDKFVERVEERDLEEQINELETAKRFISDHLIEIKAKSVVKVYDRELSVNEILEQFTDATNSEKKQKDWRDAWYERYSDE